MPVELQNALKIEDPCGLTYYLGTLSPKEIKQLTFVPVVTKTHSDDLPEMLNERAQGYQRTGEPERMKRIKDFVLKNPKCIIPPVVLCARGTWKFHPAQRDKSYGRIVAEDLAAIIDGQHRLGGLWQVAMDQQADSRIKERPIPFMAIDKMDEPEEMQEFVNINDNQKGVKKSLLHYLQRDDNFTGQAATALMEDEESVFKGRIDIQKKQDWILILFGAARECVELMFNKDFTSVKNFNPQTNRDYREPAIEFVLRYWRIISDSMPEFWSDIEKMPPIDTKKTADRPGTSKFQFRLLEETGIRAFSKLAAELFTMNWVDGITAPSWDAIESHLKKMSSRERVRRVLTKPSIDRSVLVDIDPELRSSGKAGVEAIYRHLRAELLAVR